MKYRIVILGTGNVGHHLALQLSRSGHQISVWNRTTESAQFTASICNAQLLKELTQIPSETDVCIATLSENALIEVCGSLKQFKGILLHTAGSVPMSVLKQFAQHYGVLYPLQTFTKSRQPDFRKIPVFIEASDTFSKQILFEIAQKNFGFVNELDSEKRSLLHIAAIFACNFVNASLVAAQKITETASIPFEHLIPLISETIEKLESNPPSANQTGPAVRNNEKIMSKHMQMLDNYPEIKNMYEVISKFIISQNTK